MEKGLDGMTAEEIGKAETAQLRKRNRNVKCRLPRRLGVVGPMPKAMDLSRASVRQICETPADPMYGMLYLRHIHKVDPQVVTLSPSPVSVSILADSIGVYPPGQVQSFVNTLRNRHWPLHASLLASISW